MWLFAALATSKPAHASASIAATAELNVKALSRDEL
jgi:hypothetical protein